MKERFSLTWALLGFCVILFLLTSLTTPSVKSVPLYLPLEPFVLSPLTKELLFDYPQAFTLVDQIIYAFGESTFLHFNDIPKEALTLMDVSLKIPYWKGAYDLVIEYVQKDLPFWPLNAPLFEKIREGQLWRIWTPCFMHHDLLHLLFNMMWLSSLGLQLEKKLGKQRFALFILFTAPLVNIAQYLMSGANFLGFSGVLCAILMFIWTRQRIAPWEGYRLEKGSFLFVAAFVLGMFALQIGAFLSVVFFHRFFPLPIANTAHLTGALTGFFLARSRYFASLL